MFFADDIDLLKKFQCHNVLCRNPNNGRYCYGFFNKKTNTLSTGYEFSKNEDLSIILDKSQWVYFLLTELGFD